MPAFADVVLDEIKTNLDDALKKVESGKKQITELEENHEKIKENITSLEKNIQKKKVEQKEAMETLADYNQKLSATNSARREFEKGLERDRSELDLVEKDIVAVKRKLVALEAASKALKESIDIAEDNLDKMSDRTGSWQKNKDNISSELKGIDGDISSLEQKMEGQIKLRTENQQKLNTLQKSVSSLEGNYQRLDAKYKAAVKDQERKKRD